MKNILIAIILIIAGCSKENNITPAVTTGQITFYMSETNNNWHLLVDGIDRGSLKGSANVPQCGDLAFLTLTLSTGIHVFDAKSMDGLAWGSPVNYKVTEGCHTYKAH